MLKLTMLPLAALLLALCLPAEAAQPDFTVRGGVPLDQALASLVLLPYTLAFSREPAGFERWPYEGGRARGYGGGGRELAAEAGLGTQDLGGRGAALSLGLRVRGSRHLGWSVFGWTAPAGALGPRKGALYGAHLAANYVQDGRDLLDLGLGAAVYEDPAARAGPSLELAWEGYPRAPWTLRALGRLSLLRGEAWSSLELAAGFSAGPLGVFAGYRWLSSPLGAPHGPELSLRLWL